MRLLIIMPSSSPWSRELVKRIMKLNHQVFILDISKKARETDYLSSKKNHQSVSIKNFKNEVTNFKSINTIFGYYINLMSSIFVIRSTAKSFNPDAVIVLYGGLWGLVTYLSSVRPLFIYVVGSDILIGGKLKKIITKIILSSSAHVYSNGINLKRKAEGIAPKAFITNNYLGIDVDKFYPLDYTSKDKLKIVCTRGFEKVYNNQYLVEALVNLPEEISDKIEVIFTSTGSLLDKVKRKVEELLPKNTQKNIYFLSGVADDELVRILQTSDIYVSVSLSDGSSLSLIEAMSCGLFPIVSDIPANHEWVDEKSGIFVTLSDAEVLTKAIIKAYNSIDWRIESSKINRKIVLEKANAQKNTLKFLNDIDKVIRN